MDKYSPFLKFKQGELNALINLSPVDRESIIPLLELPRDESYTDETLKTRIDKSKRRIKNKIKDVFSFYIDNYEVPDEITINKNDSYLYLLDSFSDYEIIPVVGFDRTDTHNYAGISYANKKAKKIAIRITREYFDSFVAYSGDIKLLLDKIGQDVFCDILLDCNFIDRSNVQSCEENIMRVMDDILNLKRFDKIVISGSSIPASIGSEVKSNTNTYITRNEIDLYKKITDKYKKAPLVFGDYTVVSPGYSEITVEKELILNVMTSKIIYSLLDSHYISRGRSIKSYGFAQYFSHAKDIVKASFFRGNDYSWGDNYIYEKAVYKGKNITAASIIGPTVNAHIKLMINEIMKGSI